MIIEIKTIGKGIVSKTKINYRKTKLEPISKNLTIFLQTKKYNDRKIITYLESDYFPDLFKVQWND